MIDRKIPTGFPYDDYPVEIIDEYLEQAPLAAPLPDEDFFRTLEDWIEGLCPEGNDD